MNIRAISRLTVVLIVIIVIIVAGVGAYFLTMRGPSEQVTATINVYVGYVGEKEGNNAQLFWIVTPANQTFKVGDKIKIVFNNNNTFPTPHGFYITDPKGAQIGSVYTNPNQSASTVITLSSAGRYAIWCLYFCGAWHALQGKMQNVTLLYATS